MNIDELTIGQAKQIAAHFAAEIRHQEDCPCWKASQREEALAEFLKRAAAERQTLGEWVVAREAMLSRLGLKETQPC